MFRMVLMDPDMFFVCEEHMGMPEIQLCVFSLCTTRNSRFFNCEPETEFSSE